MEARFVRAVVRAHFGDVCEALAECMYTYGGQTLMELCERCKLEAALVKKGLMSLLQHGLCVPVAVKTQRKVVAGKRKEEGKEAKAQKGEEKALQVAHRIYYELDLEAVRARTRLALYGARGREVADLAGEIIVDTFCERGKLSVENVLDIATPAFLSRQQVQAEAGSAGVVLEEKQARVAVEKAFRRLVDAGYLRRAETLSQIERRREARKRKLEEEAAAAEGKQPAKKLKTAAGKAAAVLADLEDDVQQHADDAKAVFMLDHAQFASDLAKEEVAAYVLRRVGDVGSRIVRAMLTTYPRDIRTAASGLETAKIVQLVKQMQKERHAPDIPKDVLTNTIEEMAHDTVGILRRRQGPGGVVLYSINVEGVLEDLRSRHAQAVCRDKFGEVGGRIFRILAIHRRLEEKQIAEQATADKKVARETLYQMLREGLVDFQEIPRAERNTARNFFLWGVSLKRVYEVIRESLFFTYANVRQRLEHEMQRAQPLMNKVQRREVVDAQEKQQIEKWKRGSDRLEAALLKLCPLILLFVDLWDGDSEAPN